MIRAGALLFVLLAIGGCHRAPTGVVEDAQSDAQARTSAKALSDIAAAEAAARDALPGGMYSSASPPRPSVRPGARSDRADPASEDMGENVLDR